MVIYDKYTTDSGTERVKAYFDKNVMIEREDGERFSDAKDLLTINHTYVETDEPIPAPETDLTVQDTLEILNEFGVDTND